jgi:hypothetical protein
MTPKRASRGTPLSNRLADFLPAGHRRRWYGVVALAFAVGAAAWQSSSSRPAGASLDSVPVVQTVIGLPVPEATLIGSSPLESPGETWGIAGSGDLRIVRYAQASGSQEATWKLQPGPVDQGGAALGPLGPAPGPLAGHTTPAGGVAILGETDEGEPKVEQLLVRNPGGEFREAPTLTVATHEKPAEESAKATPPEEPKPEEAKSEDTKASESPKTSESPKASERSTALLKPGEQLFSTRGDGVLMTATEQSGSTTDVFVVPAESGPTIQESVLFYDGVDWAREPICLTSAGGGCAKPTTGFEVLAIEASSPENAWLLADDPAAGEGLMLFDRSTEAGETSWRQRPLGPTGSLGAEFARSQLSFSNEETHRSVEARIAALAGGQPLTVTDNGVWIDGQLTLEPQQQTAGFTLYYDIGQARVSSSWCSAPAEAHSLCSYPLESGMPSGSYRSFAWSGGGPFGQRVITGFDDGVTLDLQGTSFDRALGAGGQSGTTAGAAFSSPQEGWLATGSSGPLTHLTTNPEPNRTQPWPVPFRRPLTAIATQPGATPGELGGQAIAVGQEGQIAHYTPGHGWAPEALLNSSGVAQNPDLRGVAWPEPGRAYAVGTDGAMWLWQSATGLWEPDPARPPNLFLANFTGIAFDPSEPSRGYAVGQQGLLLAYGKTWEQQSLPSALAGPEGANFTSIAFAGNEALATYQVPDFKEGADTYMGGVLCDDGDGTGWHLDGEADAALGGRVPVRVAGLPDGGAAIAASDGDVLERSGAGPACSEQAQSGSAWQPSGAGPLQGFPVALALFREDGTLRVVASVDTTTTESLGLDLAGDQALQQPPPAGQAAVFTAPYTLPGSGYLLRETESGWRDEEHADYPQPNVSEKEPAGEDGFDWSYEPDAVLALALDPADGAGWVVGGQTGEINDSRGQEYIEDVETASVMRYPAEGAAPQGFSQSPVQIGSSKVAFAIGGDAQCATACADLANDLIGPDAWLSNAVSHAAQTPGLRAFLYTGPRLAPGLATAGDGGSGEQAGLFQREEDRYAQLLAGSAGALPVFVAPTEYDLDQSGTLASFSAAFQTLDPPQGGAQPAADIEPKSPTAPNAAYYSFDSTGSAGRVRVIVLDYSGSALGATQQCWLAQQLYEARAELVPAIVVGNRNLIPQAELSGGIAADAGEVVSILTGTTAPQSCLPSGAKPAMASAYFFDAPEQNRAFTLSAGGHSIPTFGSGTLSYVYPPAKENTQFLGASSFMLAEVETASRNTETNQAKVGVRLIPNISELAMEATNGVLLRRSHPALFKALARIPNAGMKCTKESASCLFTPDPYVPIPSPCQGAGCSTGLLPEYTFSSSNPDIGDFVEPDPASPEGTTVLQGTNGKPIPDAHSGLFCPYNAGTTTVTVQTGGLAYSEQITVLSGSVEQPCGTAPLRNPPAPVQHATLPVPLPAPAPTPAVTPNGVVPPPPVPPPPPPAPVPVVHHAHPHPSLLPAVPLVPAQLYPILPIVPPPAPSPARPTPPSGTAQVSQTVGVAEHEREEERATEMAHHMAAYEHPEESPLPTWPLGLILIAAAAGVGMRRRSRAPELAYTQEPRRQGAPRA